ncbi:hypothetical protein BgAZ_110190 [Babesia gibsoni]|uniref:Flagellar protein FliL n=1 Tax=Babesia gibsoni TaxID=33632 RepID=A0AAD8PH06_BABGI|nr:hypothetical protein BgAZ_110190 [Babesia gibsoni]
MHFDCNVTTIFAGALLFVGIAEAVTTQGGMMPFGPSMRNAVMSGIQDSADFAIKIHVGDSVYASYIIQPPVEKLEDTLKSLDGIMMVEDAERRASDEDFVDAEQRLLSIHKGKIREIVAAAMEPIHAMLYINFDTPESH